VVSFPGMAIVWPASSLFLIGCRHDDGAVPLAETCAAIHQHVLVGHEGIAEKAERGNIVGFLLGRLVQRFDIGQDVREFHAGQTDLAGRQRIKHESIVTVGGVCQAQLSRFRCGHRSRHRFPSWRSPETLLAAPGWGDAGAEAVDPAAVVAFLGVSAISSSRRTEGHRLPQPAKTVEVRQANESSVFLRSYPWPLTSIAQLGALEPAAATHDALPAANRSRRARKYLSPARWLRQIRRQRPW